MFQCSQPVVFPFTVTACVLLSRGHKDFSLILPSKSVILLLLVYIYAVHQELYECFELGQGGKFRSPPAGDQPQLIQGIRSTDGLGDYLYANQRCQE